MTDADFFKKQAEWWRQWAKLTGSPAERVAREEMADMYERMAKDYEKKNEPAG